MYISKKVNNSKVAVKIGGALITPAIFGTYVSNSCSGLGFEQIKWIFKYLAIWFETVKDYIYHDIYLSIYQKNFGNEKNAANTENVQIEDLKVKKVDSIFTKELKQKVYDHVCGYGKKFSFMPALYDGKIFSAESDTCFVLTKEVDFLGHKKKLSIFVEFRGEGSSLKFSILGFDAGSAGIHCLYLKNPKFEGEKGKLCGEVNGYNGIFGCRTKLEEEQLGASPLERLFSAANRVFVLMNDLACLKEKKGVSLKQYRNEDGFDRYDFVFDKIIEFKDRRFGRTFRVKGISYFGTDCDTGHGLRLATSKKEDVDVKELDFSGRFLHLMNDHDWNDYLALRQAISEQLGINFGNSIGNANYGYAAAPLVNELNDN